VIEQISISSGSVAYRKPSLRLQGYNLQFIKEGMPAAMWGEVMDSEDREKEVSPEPLDLSLALLLRADLLQYFSFCSYTSK
jgi:hypothetical protein